MIRHVEGVFGQGSLHEGMTSLVVPCPYVSAMLLNYSSCAITRQLLCDRELQRYGKFLGVSNEASAIKETETEMKQNWKDNSSAESPPEGSGTALATMLQAAFFSFTCHLCSTLVQDSQICIDATGSVSSGSSNHYVPFALRE